MKSFTLVGLLLLPLLAAALPVSEDSEDGSLIRDKRTFKKHYVAVGHDDFNGGYRHGYYPSRSYHYPSRSSYHYQPRRTSTHYYPSRRVYKRSVEEEPTDDATTYEQEQGQEQEQEQEREAKEYTFEDEQFETPEVDDEEDLEDKTVEKRHISLGFGYPRYRQHYYSPYRYNYYNSYRGYRGSYYPRRSYYW